MATITPVTVTTAGAAVPKTAASVGGDSIHNAAGATLLVLNGSGSSITVAAGADEQIPVPAQCADPTTGFCAVGYSSVTTVTVAATT